MRPKLTKRACDECITRKVKCSGALPCDTCRSAPKQVKCTYLKPARRRGPKVRRHMGKIDPVAASSFSETDAGAVLDGGSAVGGRSHDEHRTISRSVLETVVRLYQHLSYSVWPVIDAEALVCRLAGCESCDTSTYCLATALCAATMAQLQLPPLIEEGRVVDSAVMVRECIGLREESNYRESLDLKSVLVSFFLHVYHAKINRRNSAWMFIQEAISGARFLKLDEWDCGTRAGSDEVIANEEILFTLLWVSERGYAMHLGLLPSYTSPIRLPEGICLASKEHAQGLLELAKLFAAFDSVSLKRSAGVLNPDAISADCLTETEAALSMLLPGEGGRSSIRMADYCITKEWMRTIIWQEALSRQMLSSKAYSELLTFRFPARVSRDLLYSLQCFSEFDLLPLGRDQLLKCFEVTNSLADVVLYTPSVPSYELQLGPQDFLHALYQKLLPFLEQDAMLKSILHAKTAEALVTAPARLLRLYDERTAENESTGNEVLDFSVYDTETFNSHGLDESTGLVRHTKCS